MKLRLPLQPRTDPAAAAQEAPPAGSPPRSLCEGKEEQEEEDPKAGEPEGSSEASLQPEARIELL